MDLKGILSISGYSGLFKLVAHAKAGIIVESLVDKKRMQAFATSKISSLEDISVYTTDGDKPLKEVFTSIYERENAGKAPDSKTKPDEIKKYFTAILPEYDNERVYMSDMKRILAWYNLLHDVKLLEPSLPETEAVEVEVVESEVEK